MNKYMGMPSVNVTFSENAQTVIKRGERGVIAMILKDAVPAKNPFVVLVDSDIPGTLSEASKKQIALARMGYVNAPKKIIVYVIETDATEYTDALAYFEVNKFDYLVIPTVETDALTSTVATWIKDQRSLGRTVKAVLPNIAADSEGIINFATESVTEYDTEDDIDYTTEQYCSRIAGIIAGTPLTIACTYAPLAELTNCTRLTKTQMNAAVDAGKLIVFHDGEKVKIARGVNSLTTTSTTKAAQFKKIKIVEAMDIIESDIKTVAEDSYLGKYANSYDNKCLLLSAIGNYFNQLIADGVLASASISIDTDANKTYLDGKGEDTSSMSDDEIKQALTGDKVFLAATIKILDAIEEITLPITI